MITVNGVSVMVSGQGYIDGQAIAALSGPTFDYEEYIRLWENDNPGSLFENDYGWVSKERAIEMAKSIDPGFGLQIDRLITALSLLVSLSGNLLEAPLVIPQMTLYTDRSKTHFRNPENLLAAVFDDLYLHNVSKEFYGVGDYSRLRNHMGRHHSEDLDKLLRCYQYFRGREGVGMDQIQKEVRGYLDELIAKHPDAYDVEVRE